MFCCMALINNISQPYLLKPHAYFNFNDAPVVSFYLASPVEQSGLVRKVERETGLEPATSCLEGRSSGQLNYSRKGKGQSEDYPREDRNFKERGEDFFFIPVLLLYQKFFEKSTHFLMNQRQYSWYASSRSGKSR